jgi:hypothetical protein
MLPAGQTPTFVLVLAMCWGVGAAGHTHTHTQTNLPTHTNTHMHTHTRTHTHACAHRDIRDIHNDMHTCMHAHHTHTRALVVGGDRTTHSEHWHCSVRTMAGFVPLNPACDPMMSFGCRTVSENHSRREGEATQMQTKWLLKLGGRASTGAHASPHVLGIPYHPCGYYGWLASPK